MTALSMAWPEGSFTGSFMMASVIGSLNCSAPRKARSAFARQSA